MKNNEFDAWIEAIEGTFVICNRDVECYDKLADCIDNEYEPVACTVTQLINCI